MSLFIVGIDIDDVVADLPAEWLRRYNRDWSDSLTRADITGWDIARLVKPECGERIFEYLYQPDLYDCVKPFPGALAGVEALRRGGCRAVFVTSANEAQSGPKLSWLDRHGFLTAKHRQSPDYAAMHDKSLLRAHALVDDGPQNLERFAGYKVLFSSTHNQEETRFPRAADWDDVLWLVKREMAVRQKEERKEISFWLNL